MEAEHAEHDHHHHPAHPGNFIGHFGPGAIFIFFGCLWTYNALFRYNVARRQALLKGGDHKKLNYKNSFFSSYYSGWAQVAPVEAIGTTLLSVVVSIGEVFTYYAGQPGMMVVHHLIIYFFFGLMGVCKILRHYKFVVPPSLEYALFIVANSVFAFLMTNHLSGREIVNRQMHMMLVYFCAILIVCVSVEMIYNKSVTASLGRSLLFTSQGMWLWVVAVVIHPLPFMPKWDLSDHVVLDVVSSIGVAVIAMSLLIAFTMSLIINKQVRSMSLATVNRIVALTHGRRTPVGGKGEAESPLITDSDYED